MLPQQIARYQCYLAHSFIYIETLSANVAFYVPCHLKSFLKGNPHDYRSSRGSNNRNVIGYRPTLRKHTYNGARLRVGLHHRACDPNLR